ncbi:MAG: SEC-C metal-binding domain-containing protein [Deltaproteobacteria bacterium]
MAIHIIGANNDEAAANVLPEPDADLPHPNGAPENRFVLEADRIRELLDHDNPIVRTFAIEQIGVRGDDDLVEAAIAKVADEDPLVAMEAIGLLERKNAKGAVDAMKKRFEEATGDLAAQLASALGHLAPDTLLEAVRARGRLDGEAYAATATALAIIGSDEVVAFLDKALNRAGALSPDRRGALYGAALLSGNQGLAGRVIGNAIGDSKEDEPENASFPTRAALCVVTGVPIPYSRKEAGLELLDMARETLEADVVPLLEGEQATALTEAMKVKNAGAILHALAPILEVDPPVEDTSDEAHELGSMPRRRRGLVAALVERADLIGGLELDAAGLFVAAATKAASIVIAGGGDESKSAGMIALAKTLGGEHDAAALAAMDEAALTKLFEQTAPRDMRRVLSVIVRETFLRGRTIERLLAAVLHGGHGEALVDAAAEVDEPSVHAAVVRAVSKARDKGEAAVLEVLGRIPLDERATTLALACAEELRTERIGLVCGRRFLDLRPHGRSALSRTLLRVGDPRLLPVLASRAFADEPEEVAWAVLALATGAEMDDKLKAAIDRTMAAREPEEREAPQVRLPLECERCKETLWYTYKRVYLDVDAKDDLGDPAFVGDPRCKACGAADKLKPTPEGGQILTQHMMQFLQAAQRGNVDFDPLVTPAQTSVGAKKMGLSEALRTLEGDIAASPDGIRPRLHRARLLLLLERPNVDEDLDAVLATDATSVEAMAMRATLRFRSGEHDEAAKWATQALAHLDAAGEDVRLYDTDDRAAMVQHLEDYVVELETFGAKLPEDFTVDLTAARRRRDEKLSEMKAMYEAQMAARQQQQRPANDAPAAPEGAAPDFRGVGRNDPCPCGSGKKFKKCHGAR